MPEQIPPIICCQLNLRYSLSDRAIVAMNDDRSASYLTLFVLGPCLFSDDTFRSLKDNDLATLPLGIFDSLTELQRL